MLEVINTQWLYRETVIKISETLKTVTVKSRTGKQQFWKRMGLWLDTLR